MDDASPLADDLGEMSSQSVHESPSPASIAGIDEQALLDAQARLALAVAAIDGAAEALVEAGLEPADCAPIERSRAALDEMQRFLALSLDRGAAPTLPRSVAITELVEATREASVRGVQADGAPDVESALALLFGDCGIGDLETDTGKRLTAVVEYRIGGLVTVSTDHGLVGTGTMLAGSIVDEAGAPWRVDLRVESERERGDRAHLALRPERIRHLERHTPAELEIGGSATLEAMECGGLYEGAEVLGRVVGLSSTGVTFATLKPLRTADRLRFHGRFFSEEVRAVVRVVSVDAEIEGGGVMVGCLFVEIDDEGRSAIDRVLDHALHPDAPISYSQLRLLTHRGPERRRGVRGLLRR
jgi:hypothetical protein